MSVFGSGGKLAVFLLCREIFITTGKIKSSSRLSGGCVSFWFWWEMGSFFVVAGNFHIDRKKKSSSRLSGGCVSFWFWREIGSFFNVAGNFHYDWKKKIHYDRKKKRYNRLSDGCAVLAITTGKKKIQSSVWQFLVLAGN